MVNRRAASGVDVLKRSRNPGKVMRILITKNALQENESSGLSGDKHFLKDKNGSRTLIKDVDRVKILLLLNYQFDVGDHYMSIHTCQNSLGCILRFLHFVCASIF